MNKLSKVSSFTLLCISCLTIMVGAVIAPGLATISHALGVSNYASLLVTLPALGAVLFAPFSGRLIVKFGAYHATAVALFLYGVIGFSGLWLYGPTAIFINRILLGAATAVIMAGGTMLISQFYVGNARLNMIAKQGMAIELGGVIFLFIGGQLAILGWYWPFSLYLMAWVFLAMLLLLVPLPCTENDSALSLTGASTNTVTSMREVYLSAVMAMVLFFTLIIILPLSMNESGYTEDQIGLFLAFISLVAVIAAHFMPRVSLRCGEHYTLMIAFGCYGLSHLVFYSGEQFIFLVIGGIFSGTGFGLSIPLLNHMTVERSHRGSIGKNLSYLAMAIFTGQFLTSFMAFIPGSSRDIYVVSAIIAALYLVYFNFKSNRV
ncbi:MFS permease [Moritella sp. JT01]|uniref:MFS transporter n=1 Tax=Moritella sp. JT01 TaxID=756698 RepID=UPI000793B826|nr:MFS transporter [Moritella sp. JT01]KXO09008.1 MFS permease [Moritella sp. JT01]